MRQVLWLLALVGCSAETADEAAAWDAATPAQMERVAPQYGGCFDTQMYAANATSTTAIIFQLPGLAAAVRAAGQPLRFSLPLPDPRVEVTYETGSYLTAGICGGARPPHQPQVARAYAASGGTLQVTARPGAGGGPPEAALSLVQPSFQQAGGGGFALAGTVDVPMTTIGIWPP